MVVAPAATALSIALPSDVAAARILSASRVRSWRCAALEAGIRMGALAIAFSI